ncbi:MAG: topoisomerase DNA-binding C4 zinc finger domain-containing protein [Candidatus Thermoplasmatota archaeon]|nr:topoisomerase DNA-binding C4 zinc finger domain-containing protein [Candidatus Thermoplasmatota archaeon]
MKCPKCGSPMIERKGKYGKFWGCSRYPSCDGSQPINWGPAYDHIKELLKKYK